MKSEAGGSYQARKLPHVGMESELPGGDEGRLGLPLIFVNFAALSEVRRAKNRRLFYCERGREE